MDSSGYGYWQYELFDMRAHTHMKPPLQARPTCPSILEKRGVCPDNTALQRHYGPYRVCEESYMYATRLMASNGSAAVNSSDQSLPSEVQSVPHHVAVVMDGNARWAEKRNLSVFDGHRAGVEALRRTVRCAVRWGIQCLTVFALSTENWQRDRHEVDFLLGLIERVIEQEVGELQNAGVRLNFIGSFESLPTSLQQQIARCVPF